MLSIESLILGVFNFFTKLFNTIVSIGFRTRSLFKDLCLGHTDKYLNSKIYLVISVLCTITLFSSSQGDSFLERFKLASLDLTNVDNLILAFPVALSMYAAIFKIAHVLQLSPKYFLVYIDYALYWIGTYIWGFVLGSLALIFALDLLGHNDLDGTLESDVLFFGSISAYGLFFLLTPIFSIGFLGIFSKNWFKFSSVAFVAPCIIILTAILVSIIKRDVEDIEVKKIIDVASPDLKIGDRIRYSILDSITTDSSNQYRMEVKFQIRNFGDEPTYLKNFIRISGYIEGSESLGGNFRDDNSGEIMEIRPRQIVFYRMTGWIDEAAYRTLRSSIINNEYLFVRISGSAVDRRSLETDWNFNNYSSIVLE